MRGGQRNFRGKISTLHIDKTSTTVDCNKLHIFLMQYLKSVKVKVTQSCPTVCKPGQNTGVGSLSLRQGIFPIQGLNPGLPHCGQTLYQLSHKGSPRILEWVAYLFSSESSQPRNQTGVSCIAGRFFTNWAIREALKLLLKYLYKEIHSIIFSNIITGEWIESFRVTKNNLCPFPQLSSCVTVAKI